LSRFEHRERDRPAEARFQGVNIGSANAKSDIAMHAEVYVQSWMNLDDRVSRRISLRELDDGYAALNNEVKRAIVNTMPAFQVGDPADPKTAVGPMVNQKQYERVQAYIRKSIEEGAEVLVGGKGRPRGLEAGYFVKPTVFVNVKNDMTIAQEEIFGPVLSVIAYETEEDAIRIANDTSFGLHAFVSGTDVRRARRVACQIQAGRVAINGMLDDQQAPFGGFKHSGVGREFGTYGIEAFLEPRAILE
jgi:aldehyde dehydrogenase (NAD+)